ncbi:MAG TPA: hypothetical protein VG367_08625 [Mucilaginibacter sp.]|jgi:hypothetical protein|nr:hypothetical protein [Mucilaginibacter sp.]
MIKILSKTATLYRAVCDAELDDINNNGLRCDPNGDGYQTCKLFALNIEAAAKFGKSNFELDSLCNTIIEVKLSGELYQQSEKLQADGMDVVSIEENYLILLKARPLNCSPIV